MSSDSAPGGIGRAQAGPLIDALRDDLPATRLAVFDALTRLPLDRDCWFDVREYVMGALWDPSAPEHPEVIRLATRVPTRTVRQRLVDIAEGDEPEERRIAALALGRAGDEQAAAPLLGLLDEEPEAAEVLALIDTSAVVDEIEQRWRRDGGVFLAVALAKSGRADALVAELERLSSDPELAEEWLYTDETTELEQALARAAPLPDEVRGAVDREWSGLVRPAPRLGCPLLAAGAETSRQLDLEDVRVRRPSGCGARARAEGARQWPSRARRLPGRTSRKAHRRPLSEARPGTRAQPLRLAARVRAP